MGKYRRKKIYIENILITKSAALSSVNFFCIKVVNYICISSKARVVLWDPSSGENWVQTLHSLSLSLSLFPLYPQISFSKVRSTFVYIIRVPILRHLQKALNRSGQTLCLFITVKFPFLYFSPQSFFF